MKPVVIAVCALLCACGGPSAPYDQKLLKAYPSDRTPHVEGAGIGFQDKVWLVGGTPGSASNGCECEDSATANVDVWDPATDSWSDGPKIHNARGAYPGVFLVNDTLYLLGGIGPASTYQMNVEKLAPPYTSWEEIPGTNTESVFYTRAAGVVGSKIIIKESNQVGTPLIFDTATNKWSHGSTASPVGSFASGAVVNGKLYSLGGLVGDPSAGEEVVEDDRIHSYDPASDSWDDVAELPAHPDGRGKAISESMSVELSGKLLTMGGDKDGDSLVEFDPAKNTANRYEKFLQEPRGDHVLAVANGHAYLLGGIRPETTDVLVKTIEVKKK